ncbi:MAG TPA: heavy metal translocating P-type ATPase, partial [Armatimonadota bacterium]|nr:heavy metal translocating P-type ATPase [Armatimonadota bacterium]
DCADCAMKLERRLRALPGVAAAAVNFASAKLTVTHHAAEDAILRAIRDAGYAIAVQPPPDGAHPCACAACDLQRPRPWRTHGRVITTALSGALIAAAWLLDHRAPLGLPAIVLYLLAMGIGGYWTFRRGLSALRALSFDMNALMTIAVSGALLIRQWEEAGVVAFLYSLSNLLESYTMEKTRRSIRGLMELAPTEARVLRDGEEQCVPVAMVRPGDVVVVTPAAKIPVDGTVIAGASAVNQAPITGEAMPVEKRPGDPVYAGTLNTLGALEVRATRTADDTTLAHIIHQVEEAQARRAPAQAFIERFARWYTPAALGAAGVIAIVVPLTLPLFGIAAPWADWCYRALALLVVACPCALVISTPVAIVTAIGTAARHGVLIKGGVHLEQAGRIAVIAFDKTGTLTRGRPDVTDVVALDGMATDGLLGLAAAVERRAAHPLADAILRAASRDGVAIPPAEGFRALPGQGAMAVVGGTPTYVGSPALFAELGAATSAAEPHVRALRDDGKTAMLVGTDERILGIIAAADGVRAESAGAIRGLRRAGIRQVAMLSGDHAEVATALAARLDIDAVKAELLPAA